MRPQEELKKKKSARGELAYEDCAFIAANEHDATMSSHECDCSHSAVKVLKSSAEYEEKKKKRQLQLQLL